MNSNAKLIFTSLIALSILSVGLIFYSQIQPTSATIADLPRLDQIPGLDKLRDLIGDKFPINTSPSTNEGYLDVDKAVVSKLGNKVHAILQLHGHIPKDGSGGAFGYGILTTQGLNAIMVSTTHAGTR